MSKDKHKKRDRAHAFLRGLRNRQHGVGQGYGPGIAAMPFSGKPSKLMRYCIERGIAKIRRVACWDHSNTNVFDGDGHKRQAPASTKSTGGKS